MANEWLDRIDYLLSEELERESQIRFLRSVRTQVQWEPNVFPTPAQAHVVLNMYRHFLHVKLNRMDKEVTQMYLSPSVKWIDAPADIEQTP